MCYIHFPITIKDCHINFLYKLKNNLFNILFHKLYKILNGCVRNCVQFISK